MSVAGSSGAWRTAATVSDVPVGVGRLEDGGVGVAAVEVRAIGTSWRVEVEDGGESTGAFGVVATETDALVHFGPGGHRGEVHILGVDGRGEQLGHGSRADDAGGALDEGVKR